MNFRRDHPKYCFDSVSVSLLESPPPPKKPFARGLDYVAASRPTELANLTLLAPLTVCQLSAYPQERHYIREEYTRLKELQPNT